MTLGQIANGPLRLAVGSWRASRIGIPNRLRRLLAFGRFETASKDFAEAKQILELTRDGVLVASLSDSDVAVTHVNRAFERITGYRRDEVRGKNCRYLQGNDRLQPEIAMMRTAIAERREVAVTLRNYRKDGVLFWNEVRLFPLTDEAGSTTHYLGLIRDVTSLREMEARLDASARFDRLTGVLNRYAFIDEVDQLRSIRPGRLLIVKIDIISLQEVNSGYGYDAGDIFIKQVAARLSALTADPLGQLGESEFALAYVMQEEDDPEAFVAAVITAMEPSFTLPGAVVQARFAIGYVIGDLAESTLSLTRQAGVAVREGRSNRLNKPRKFDQDSELAARKRIRLTAELQQALRDGDFLYHYQPKVDLPTGNIIGAEALMRWQHKIFGLQAPSVFIQMAEETRLILDLEAHGLRQVAAFAKRVNTGRETPVIISVNISPLEITHRDLVGLVSDVLAESGADPSWITLELTESLLTESSPEILRILRGLRALGIGLAIDDFGTGHSSLRYLDSFPISEIKIDKSFVRDMAQNGVKRIIAETVTALGRQLGAFVVAEGIETTAEKTLLEEMNCPMGQGYLFGRPVDEAAFLAMLPARAEPPKPVR
jgi:PAS domain S-box-containing protein